jgi:hypothetical protein
MGLARENRDEGAADEPSLLCFDPMVLAIVVVCSFLFCVCMDV